MVKDEWNTDEIIDEHILNNKRLMIRGDVPGTGKSYICQHLQNRNYKVLFVVPTNNVQLYEPILNVMEKHFGWSEGNEICENNIAYTNKGK